MAEHKAGLHKKISVIFDGVPIPGDDKPLRTSSEAVPEVPKQADGTFTKLPETPVAPAVQAPKHQQPVRPSSKDVSPKRSDAGGSRQPETVSRKQFRAESAPKDSGQKLWQRIWGQIRGRLFAPKPGVNTARQKLMMILIPVLSIIFVFVLVGVFSGTSQKPTKRPNAAKAPSNTVYSGDKINWEVPPLYPENMRDPMQFGAITASAGIAGTEGNQLAVKGIVYSKDNPSAVIGTQIVHRGDKVSGATILNINEDSVEFETDGKKWTQKVQR